MEKNVTKATYVVKNESVILVAIITEEQAIKLIGQAYDKYGSLFCPVQDVNDNWVISQVEIESNVNAQFKWVNSLVLVEYKPKPEMTWW